MREVALIHRQILVQFPGRDFQPVFVPFEFFSAHEAFEDVRAERITDYVVHVEFLKRLLKRTR